MSDNIFLVVEVAIKAGEFDNFKVVLKDMVDATQADEPNTLNYEWFISEDKKNCHICERYADSAALMVHMKNLGEKFMGRLLATADLTQVMAYGNASVEVKEVLRGFGAVHLTLIDGFAR